MDPHDKVQIKVDKFLQSFEELLQDIMNLKVPLLLLPTTSTVEIPICILQIL